MTEPTDDLTGKQLGEYLLESLLGQGGMARVYLATDVRLRRRAVIKVIDPPARNDPTYMQRFEREAQIIGQLDHPHIVRLYRFDEQDGWLYMAMQYVEGADLGVLLSNYRDQGTFMPPDVASQILRETALALDYAHRQGIIHRDVKPANILVDRQGKVFLSDFGLALITDLGTRGEIFGSPHYMAPEQAVSSSKVVPQSDLYALGVILYEIFTGQVPFDAERPLDIAFLQITEPPTPPREKRAELTPELEAVMMKALAKKPEDRYQTGLELADALDAALAANLIATEAAAQRQSILERVAIELGEAPLPPLPAAVADLPPMPAYAPPPPPPTAPTPAPVVVAQPAPVITQPAPPVKPAPATVATPPSPLRQYGPMAAGLGVFLLLTCLCLGIIFNRMQAAASPNLPATPTGSGPITTPRQQATIPVNNTKATATKPAKPPTRTPQQPTPTKSSITYTISIIREKESLIVFNKSSVPFPVKLLRLSKDDVGLNWAAWGVELIKQGECLAAKLEGKTPENILCTRLGDLKPVKKDNWLGNKDFDVLYKNQKVGECNKKEKSCDINITVSQP